MNARAKSQVARGRDGSSRASARDEGERKRLASLAGQARARSLEIERRIAINFKYAAAAAALRGSSSPVLRMRTFAGRLPGIYPAER